MKRIFIFAFTFCFALSLCACAKKERGETAPSGTDNTGTTENAAAGSAPDADNSADISDAGDVTGEDTTEAEQEWKAASITVAWAEDKPDLTDYYEFYASQGEGAVRVAVFTDTPVRDFRILRLSDPRADDETGELRFKADTRFTPGVFTPEHPIVIRTRFDGDLPTNAVSYIDENGQPRVFALDISGMDGSLLLTPVAVDPS